MKSLIRFIKKYKTKIIYIILEEYIVFFVRYLPGYFGMAIRFIFYKLLFQKIKSFPLIYAGTHFTHSYGIKIGSGFSINSGCVIDGRGGITIGDNVMIGPNTVIVSSAHQFEQVSNPMNSYDHIFEPVIIKNDIWIGANVSIKGGVTINSHSVVAAGSVVTKDVGEYEIVGGVPATLIRKRTNKEL